MKQLRIIAGNAALYTGMTHEAVLQHLNWPNPATLILRSVRALRSMLEERQTRLFSTDLLHTADWSHLPTLEHWLTQVMDAAPVIEAMPNEEHQLACPICTKTFVSNRALRAHLKVVHTMWIRDDAYHSSLQMQFMACQLAPYVVYPFLLGKAFMHTWPHTELCCRPRLIRWLTFEAGCPHL